MVQVTFNVWGNTAIDRTRTIDREAPTYVIIHGYQSTGGNSSNGFKPADWMANIANTIRQRESNANIILVDWEKGASSWWYPTAAGNTSDVGNQLGSYLRTIGVDPNLTTLIGHSLGAHIAGFAGTNYRNATGRLLGQIVGLDPAGPSFEGVGTAQRLDPSDAKRVIAFHTSETLGYDGRLGTLDVYVNWNDMFQPGQWNFAGNHSYAHTLYTQLLQGLSFRQSNGTFLNLNTVVNDSFVGQNNSATKNNQATVALNFAGTAGVDKIAGGAGNDNLTGGNGDDFISAGDGNDNLLGEGGNDRLYGGRGNDTLTGGTGNDRLFGDAGDDVLIGADPLINRGTGEIDRLFGGAGRDRFVLGTSQGVFYRGQGNSDYALILDFSTSEDVIQLSGSKSNYRLGSVPTGLPAGTALFHSSNDLVAIIQGASGLNLNSAYFVTV
jgi:pimeloyl-ACP methyl ester carboxylesterase